MKKNFCLVIIICFSCLCHAQQITLEGKYSYKNIYIQNPHTNSGFCTEKVLVNGKEIQFAQASAFEIKLDSLGFTGGEALKIEIFHKPGCKPKVLMDNTTPRHDLSLINLSVDGNGVLSWQTKAEPADSILKVEMDLSAFGVEADNFPSIKAFLDFAKDSSHCVKSFYNPAYKGSTYSLSTNDMKAVLQLLKTADLPQLKRQYTVNLSDQPRSTITIHTAKATYTIDDYGLVGEYPLKELYRIVYKW